MKKIIYLIGALIIVFTACNKNDGISIDNPDNVPSVEVAFSPTLVGGEENSESFLKSTDYDRPATAPAYITGIEITADNQAYHLVEDIVGTFLFEDTDDNIAEPMTMDVKAGINHFSAISTSDVDTIFWGHTQYFSPKLDITDPNYDELLERATFYGTELLKDSNLTNSTYDGYPLHALYATEQVVSQEISFTTNNPVDLDLLPQNGRVNVIMESNPESSNLGFGVWTTLYAADSTQIFTTDNYNVKVDSLAQGDRFDYPDPIAQYGVHSIDTTAAVWVFNMDQMVDGTYINVQVAKRAKTSTTSDDWVYILDDNIDVEQRKNKTYLIYFNGESAVTAGFSATMTPFTNTYDTTEL